MRNNAYQQQEQYDHYVVDAPSELLEWLLANLKQSRSKVKATLQGRGVRVGGKVVTQFDYRLEPGMKVAVSKVKKAAEVADILQIPAFLCRQTDLLVAAAKTGKTVNIKKAQFLAGRDMRYPVEKAREAGAKDIWLTERGNMMGYGNLVVDFRNISDMLDIVPTVVMDCTHSVQRPDAQGGKTGGDRRFVPSMALAAKAFGATGYFFEVHPTPDQGLSDAANMLELDKLENLVKQLIA